MRQRLSFSAVIILVCATPGWLFANIVVENYTTPYVSSNDPVDAGLPLKISSSDLLHGAVLTASGASNGFRYNDGTGGEMDFNPDGRVSYFDNPGSYEVVFNDLGGIDVGEIRAFSVGSAARSKQDFDVAYSTNDGLSYTTIANVVHSQDAASNVSQLFDDSGALLATGVTNLRFTLYPVGNSVSGLDQHANYVEIDAFATAPIPEPKTAALCGLLVLGGLLRRRSHRNRRHTSNAISSNSTAGTPSV